MLMKLGSQPNNNEGTSIDMKEIHEPRMPCNDIKLSFRNTDYMISNACAFIFSNIFRKY